MIILTSVNRTPRYLYPGDQFNLRIHDATGSEVVISETITVRKTINFIASYRFALEDGTCPGFHLCGIFGNSAELPGEMLNAIHYDDLPADKRANFVRTVGVALSR